MLTFPHTFSNGITVHNDDEVMHYADALTECYLSDPTSLTEEELTIKSELVYHIHLKRIKEENGTPADSFDWEASKEAEERASIIDAYPSDLF